MLNSRSAVLFALVAGVFLVRSPHPPSHAAKPLKDIQVYPKDISRKELKKKMKAISKELGRKCEDCHALPAFEKDTELKTAARKMIRLTQELNAQMKKDGFRATVTCGTCHRGEPIPTAKP